MSNDANHSEHHGLLQWVWNPAAGIYLVGMLFAFLMGLRPDLVHPRDPYEPAPLPVLQTLVVGQMLLFLLAYPMIWLHRRCCMHLRIGGVAIIVESLMWMLAGLVMYVPAVWLANGDVEDLIRGCLQVLGVLPIVWVACAWIMRKRKETSAVLIVLLVISLGLVALAYLAAEFWGAALWTSVVWQLSPVIHGWDVADVNHGGILPDPLWSWWLWPMVALPAYVVYLAVIKRGGGSH